MMRSRGPLKSGGVASYVQGMLQVLDRPLPQPPITTRARSQLETYLVLRRNPLELWGEAAYELPVLPGRFLGRGQVLINDPDAIRHVLVDNHENYGRSIGTKRVLQPVLGAGLLLAEGKAWRHQRRTIAPALAPRVMPVLARHVVHATEAKERALTGLEGKAVELLPHLQELALTIAAQSMFSVEIKTFGVELRALLLRYAQNYAKVGFLDLVLPPGLPTPTDLGRARFRRDWLRLVDRVIDAREALPRREGGPRDLFDLLASAQDPESGARFSRSELRDEVATMILAGHETTAVTLFWACWLAARFPEAADRIAEEAGAVDLSADQAAGGMKSLPYTRAFIDETLRLYPPAYLIVRQALGADRIGGHAIEAGTVVSIAPWVLHRHRAFWSEPQRFDPGRFLADAVPPARYAYMPFGAGPRVCVGAQFALTEAVVALARLLRRFRLAFAGDGHTVPRGIVTTQPDRPVPFILTRRAA